MASNGRPSAYLGTASNVGTCLGTLQVTLPSKVDQGDRSRMLNVANGPFFKSARVVTLTVYFYTEPLVRCLNQASHLLQPQRASV